MINPRETPLRNQRIGLPRRSRSGAGPRAWGAPACHDHPARTPPDTPRGRWPRTASHWSAATSRSPRRTPMHCGPKPIGWPARPRAGPPCRPCCWPTSPPAKARSPRCCRPPRRAGHVPPRPPADRGAGPGGDRRRPDRDRPDAERAGARRPPRAGQHDLPPQLPGRVRRTRPHSARGRGQRRGRRVHPAAGGQRPPPAAGIANSPSTSISPSPRSSGWPSTTPGCTPRLPKRSRSHACRAPRRPDATELDCARESRPRRRSFRRPRAAAAPLAWRRVHGRATAADRGQTAVFAGCQTWRQHTRPALYKCRLV
jgi:hypothetical protein